MSTEEFIEEAKKWLTNRDFLILSGINTGSLSSQKSKHYFLRRLNDFDYSLRTQLSYYRKAKQTNSQYQLRSDLAEIIQENRNPLDIEIGILRLRWDFLEEQGKDHIFNLEALIIYFLKLQILKQLAQFDKEKGSKRFDMLSKVAE